MSDFKSLQLFGRQPVNNEMVMFLCNTTCAIIQVPKPTSKTLLSPKSLDAFIWNLIKHSNVQTPTLMATAWYLNKLRCILPANAVGMESTRHRIFLAALILSAKALNDSLPLNKHWAKYTDGLLTLDEVNCAERELLALLKWRVVPNDVELASALHPFVNPIKLLLASSSSPNYKSKAPVASPTSSRPYYQPGQASRSTSSLSLLSNYSNLSLSGSSSQTSLNSSVLSHSLNMRKPLASKGPDYLNTRTRIVS